MKKSRFSEEQIIRILEQHQSGTSTQDLCREHGISTGTFYRWKAKCLNMHLFIGLEASWSKIEDWRLEYNEVRPHSSLNFRTPSEFAAVLRGQTAGGRSENFDAVI